MHMLLADTSEVASVALLRRRARLRRLDVGPFIAIVYPALVAFFLTFPAYEIALLSTGFVVSIHALVLLSSRWSVRLERLNAYSPATEPTTAEFVFVTPVPEKGSPAIVPLDPLPAPATSVDQLTFTYQKRRYSLETSTTASIMAFPTGHTVGKYLSSTGHSTASAAEVRERLGCNAFDMPEPLFGQLLVEQLMAPIFVFQLFCMLLYCLDDYWYFSIFTLIMLVLIETMTAKKRLRDLRELRAMRPASYPIAVYRDRKWTLLPTDELVAGDLVCLERSGDDRSVPADLVLLSGTCVVNEALLTGESTPLLKESVSLNMDSSVALAAATPGSPSTAAPSAASSSSQPRKLHLQDLPNLASHLVFSGTECLQISPPSHQQHKSEAAVSAPVPRGCVAYVLRTGFATEQGNVLRTVLGSTARVSADSREVLYFIGFLLLFALAAAGYVFYHGFFVGPARKTSKLIVECLLILVSVIPPDMPVQLSLAVNQSLIAMSKLLITCTEPFRIPFGGKVDVCCFDKTGTLTSNQFAVQGVAGLSGDSLTPADVVSPDSLSAHFPDTALVLGSCHSLLHLDGRLAGDPLELAILRSIDWTFSASGEAAPASAHGRGLSAQVLQRFAFHSAIKRMSAVVQVTDPASAGKRFLAVCKGAPEVLRPLFAEVPAEFDSLLQRFTLEGARVLALGLRDLGSRVTRPSDVRALDRSAVEQGLTFAGLLIVSSPLKSHSRKAVRALLKANHHVVMITGDNPLTACHVASKLHITDKPTLQLDAVVDGKGADARLSWRPLDGSAALTEPASSTAALLSSNDLCVTGPMLATLSAWPESLPQVLPFVKVFARTTPDQKTMIVSKLQDLGMVVLMCGDGTNDVGALRRARVGVSLLSCDDDGVDLGSGASTASNLKSSKSSRKRSAAPSAAPAAYSPLADEVTVPKLGDASIASSFTARSASAEAVVNIVRQGRCTLVITLQMLKIIALNSLVAAYSMSVLYLDGIKLSDTQMTVSGLVITLVMLEVSRSTPTRKLSPQRPLPSIVNVYMVLSVLAQSVLHLGILAFAMRWAALETGDKPQAAFDPDDEQASAFEATLLNTTVYILTLAMQATIMAVNYEGAPFMDPLHKRVALLLAIGSLYGLALMALSGGVDDMLELVPMSPSFRHQVLLAMAADAVGSWLIDRSLRLVFGSGGQNQALALLNKA